MTFLCCVCSLPFLLRMPARYYWYYSVLLGAPVTAGGAAATAWCCFPRTAHASSRYHLLRKGHRPGFRRRLRAV